MSKNTDTRRVQQWILVTYGLRTSVNWTGSRFDVFHEYSDEPIGLREPEACKVVTTYWISNPLAHAHAERFMERQKAAGTDTKEEK